MTRSEALQVAKPILFNTEMVRAIQDGTKTATRRVMKPQPDGVGQSGNVRVIRGCPPPPYEVGDILYVRETWCKGSLNYGKEQYYYRADNKIPYCEWHPSIHMPKEAARIFLRVTGVRVERLQDMTEEDAFKEGFSGIPWCAHSVFENYPDSPIPCDASDGSECPPDPPCNHSIPELFGTDIWDKTIKKSDLEKYGWDANPWVWVIEFERLEVTE